MSSSPDPNKLTHESEMGGGATCVSYVPADEAEGGATASGGGAMRIEPKPSQAAGKKKAAPQKKLDSWHMCIRYILVLGNCIFFLLGCTVIGLGIYVVVDKVNLVSGLFGNRLVAPASYLIIAAGCVVFIISFIGCFGSLFESKSVLILYSTALGLVLLLSCLGFILAIVFRRKVNDQIRDYMRKTIQLDYGVNLDSDWNRMVTDAWDGAQHKWYCCAVDREGWNVYRNSEWYKVESAITDVVKPMVPKSCCQRDQYDQYISLEKCQLNVNGPPATQSSSEDNTALFYLGCFEAGKEVLYEIAGYLIGIGVALTILVIAGLVLAVLLARKV